MPRVESNGIEIEYESYGSSSHETILLIMGLGSQLTMWPMELVQTLVARGYRVIRYDNRDCGLSTWMEQTGLPDMGQVFAAWGRGRAPAPYTLEDMAADAIGLLDALEVKQAHVAGASMGGMIAQLIAALYPERVLSLISIMSSSGNPMLPAGTPQALSVLMTPAPPRSNPAAAVEHNMKAYLTIASPGFPPDQVRLRELVQANVARSYYPKGIGRHLAAVITNGDRRPLLRRIKAPTIVLHGADDPLIPLEAGKDTAANIEGAELRIIPGMGHDIPLALVPQFADAILTAAERASPKAQRQAPATKPKAPPKEEAPAATFVMEPETQPARTEDLPRRKFLNRLKSWFGPR